MGLPANGGPGRPPGSPNKISAKFAKTLEKHGVDLVDEFIDAYNKARDKENLFLMVQILTQMAPYVYPKLKSIEVMSSVDVSTLSKEEKIAALENMLRELKNE